MFLFRLQKLYHRDEKDLICQLSDCLHLCVDKSVCGLRNFGLKTSGASLYRKRKFFLLHDLYSTHCGQVPLIPGSSLTDAGGVSLHLWIDVQSPHPFFGAVSAKENWICWKREVGMWAVLTPAPAPTKSFAALFIATNTGRAPLKTKDCTRLRNAQGILTDLECLEKLHIYTHVCMHMMVIQT